MAKRNIFSIFRRVPGGSYVGNMFRRAVSELVPAGIGAFLMNQFNPAPPSNHAESPWI